MLISSKYPDMLIDSQFPLSLSLSLSLSSSLEVHATMMFQLINWKHLIPFNSNRVLKKSTNFKNSVCFDEPR